MSSKWLRSEGERAWIMGVLNCTPDSFSDGGKFAEAVADPAVEQFTNQTINVDAAVCHALTMHEQGAAIIDVGGESTRPGSAPVSLAQELKRVIPVIQALAARGVTLSIDTSKAEVMRRAISAGASMVNDVTALRGDPDSLTVVAETGVDVCLMHMQGTPETMQNSPAYRNVMDEVILFLEARIEACLKAGVSESSLLIDPGIGFGKCLEDNLLLIANAEVLKQHFGLPLLLGVSRKSFLGEITGSDVHSREVETAAAVSIAAFTGSDMLRVHDVKTQRKAVDVGSRLRDAYQGLS